MYGNAIKVTLDKEIVILQPPKKEEVENMAHLVGSMIAQMYLGVTQGSTPQDEADWWENARKSENTYHWGIFLEQGKTLVGITTLFNIHPLWNNAKSGIVIADSKHWGKGIAYKAHLARTWYAARILNRYTIQSTVWTPNVGSLKALQKVGYRISGQYDKAFFRGVKGGYIDGYCLSWVNPAVTSILYPDGIPNKLKPSLKKAQKALDLADKVCSFI